MLDCLLDTSCSLNVASDSYFGGVNTRRALVITHFQDSTEAVFLSHAVDELLDFINSLVFVRDESLDGELAHHNLVD